MPARSLNTSLPCSAKPRLTAFSGLKALAVIGIIACHMGALPGWDLCARMVEVLFLVSGFCMAYNHFCPSDTPTFQPSDNTQTAAENTSNASAEAHNTASRTTAPTALNTSSRNTSHHTASFGCNNPAINTAALSAVAYPSGWQIVKAKLPRLYPVHFATFLLQLFFVPAWSSQTIGFILSFGLLNLTLQHAWFQSTQFMFNNVSWFLSALLFCYFITPALSRAAARAKAARRLFLFFALLVAIRLYIEYMRSSYPSYIRLDLHANPLVQALNYSLGFIAGVFFLSPSPLNAVLRQRLSFAAATLLETLFAGLYLAACYSLGGTAYRLFFVLLALPVIYVLAFGRGALSRIISAKPLLWFETVNLEIFMFHSFILYHFPVNADNPWYYAEFAAITLAAAAGFHLLFRRRTK